MVSLATACSSVEFLCDPRRFHSNRAPRSNPVTSPHGRVPRLPGAVSTGRTGACISPLKSTDQQVFCSIDQRSKYKRADQPNLEDIGRKTEVPRPTYGGEKNKDDKPIEECLADKDPGVLLRPNRPFWFHVADRETYMRPRDQVCRYW